MKIADPHVHFWDTAALRYPWLDKPEIAYSGDNRLLPKRFLPEDLLAGNHAVEVVRTVHVEANPKDPVAEAQWLQSLALRCHGARHPHGIIAGIDFSAPDAHKILESLSTIPNVRGVRQILNRHPDPLYNYVDNDYLDDTNWRRNLGGLAKRGWSFDLQLYPAQAKAAVEVIQENPDISFIVNHTGMFVDRTVQGWSEWRGALRALAGHVNTAIKISGLAMFDHSWTRESLRPLILETINAFGIERSMFASNFPIDGLHASYEAQWSAYSDIVSDLNGIERESLFAGNAVRIYRLAPI